MEKCVLINGTYFLHKYLKIVMGVLLPLIKLVNHYYFDDANFMDFAHMAS
jgi:hypothetical protein